MPAFQYCRTGRHCAGGDAGDGPARAGHRSRQASGNAMARALSLESGGLDRIAGRERWQHVSRSLPREGNTSSEALPVCEVQIDQPSVRRTGAPTGELEATPRSGRCLFWRHGDAALPQGHPAMHHHAGAVYAGFPQNQPNSGRTGDPGGPIRAAMQPTRAATSWRPALIPLGNPARPSSQLNGNTARTALPSIQGLQSP